MLVPLSVSDYWMGKANSEHWLWRGKVGRCQGRQETGKANSAGSTVSRKVSRPHTGQKHLFVIEKFRWYSILSPSSCQSRSWAKTGSAWKPHWQVGWAFPRFPTQSSFSPGSQWLRLNPVGFDVPLGLRVFLSNSFLKLTPNQLASPFQEFSREGTYSDPRWAIPS